MGGGAKVSSQSAKWAGAVHYLRSMEYVGAAPSAGDAEMQRSGRRSGHAFNVYISMLVVLSWCVQQLSAHIYTFPRQDTTTGSTSLPLGVCHEACAWHHHCRRRLPVRSPVFVLECCRAFPPVLVVKINAAGVFLHRMCRWVVQVGCLLFPRGPAVVGCICHRSSPTRRNPYQTAELMPRRN